MRYFAAGTHFFLEVCHFGYSGNFTLVLLQRSTGMIPAPAVSLPQPRLNSTQPGLFVVLGALRRCCNVPWIVEQIPGGFTVLDANGQSLAYVYGRETKADLTLPMCSRWMKREG